MGKVIEIGIAKGKNLDIENFLSLIKKLTQDLSNTSHSKVQRVKGRLKITDDFLASTHDLQLHISMGVLTLSEYGNQTPLLSYQFTKEHFHKLQESKSDEMEKADFMTEFGNDLLSLAEVKLKVTPTSALQPEWQTRYAAAIAAKG